MAWADARARIKNRLEAVTVTGTLTGGTTLSAYPLRRVFEFPPAAAIEPGDTPCCVMVGSSYAASSLTDSGYASALLTEHYVETVHLLVYDEELASAVEIIELFRPAIVQIFAADVTLNGNASRIFIQDFARPASTDQLGVNAPGALLSTFDINVRLDGAQTYAP